MVLSGALGRPYRQRMGECTTSEAGPHTGRDINRPGAALMHLRQERSAATQRNRMSGRAPQPPVEASMDSDCGLRWEIAIAAVRAGRMVAADARADCARPERKGPAQW